MTPTLILGLLLALLIPVGHADGADPAAGTKLNLKHCAKCHGDSGKGDGTGLKRLNVDVKPVDWTNKTAMSKWKQEDLVKIIKGGGEAIGKSDVMPSYAKKLTDAEVADLVAYIRSLAK